MVPISPNIYSAEAVVFDNKGLFDLQQKIADRRAKKQAAEQEALDTYLKEMSKIPESYGMRNIDKKEFAKKVDDFRLLSNEFRKSPKNLEKRLQLEQAADQLKLFVSRSKEAKEGTKSFNNFILDISTNPEKRKSVDIQKLMLDKEIHDLPLDFNAPYLGIVREDKEFNPNYYIPKPFDFQKTFDESAKGPGIAISELGVGPSKTKGYDEIKKGFGESAIKSIASNFAKNVEADGEKESYYKVRFNNLTPEKLAEQNIRLKKYFPKMEVDDDNPVSLAMAEAIEEAERRISTDLRAKGTGTGGGYGYGGDQANISIKGNSLDEIGTVKTVMSGNTSIVDGIARDIKGDRWTGDVDIEYEDLPANLVAVMEFNKTPIDSRFPNFFKY
jgi:uncharacterized protein YeeX (DUF496 family)